MNTVKSRRLRRQI